MNEHDANRALAAAAGLSLERDPLEDTQFMPIYDRRRRQREAAGQHLCAMVADEAQRQIDKAVDELVVKAGWPDFHEPARTGFDRLVKMPPALCLGPAVGTAYIKKL